MQNFTDMIRVLENMLPGEVDISTLAREAGMSVYELRRVFTFVAGMSLGEYIRKRRLSLAAAALLQPEASVSQVAIDYGYDSPSSFTRAYKEFHSISPMETVKTGSFRAMTRLDVQIVATGGTDIGCCLRQLPGFTLHGFRGASLLSDTECCEAVWNAFYASPHCHLPGEKLFAAYEDREDRVICTIGTNLPYAQGDALAIPTGLWACFPMHTTEDAEVNRFYSRILQQWLASVPYVRDENLPTVEVFPMDMTQDGFAWEIRIPLKEAPKCR